MSDVIRCKDCKWWGEKWPKNKYDNSISVNPDIRTCYLTLKLTSPMMTCGEAEAKE